MSYLKLLDNSSEEYSRIKSELFYFFYKFCFVYRLIALFSLFLLKTEVLDVFNEIHQLSNAELNKMSNFQVCYDLQYMIESLDFNLVENSRMIIKQGPLNKVSKRNGGLFLRHFALVIQLIVVFFVSYSFFFTNI